MIRSALRLSKPFISGLLCCLAFAACGGGSDPSSAAGTATDSAVASTRLVAEASTATATDTTATPQVATANCAAGMLRGGAVDRTFALAGWPDRDYDLELPASYRCGQPIGVVLVFHGGGGNKDNMRPLTCPNGDVRQSGCLDRSALSAGLAVVFANGTNARGSKLLNRGGLRTWNAGGGQDGYNCASGSACTSGVDDVGYTKALLADLAKRIDIDGRKIYATGFSNGAALAQRLACEAAETFAAIAPVSGENQFAHAVACTPVQRVAVLDIHGTADRCWPYLGGNGACIDKDLYVSVAETLSGWTARNGCAATATLTTLPPLPGVDDGTSVVRHTYSGCGAGGELEHLEVVGQRPLLAGRRTIRTRPAARRHDEPPA